MKIQENENQYDVIVIGSGLGGLSTAGLLSKINKKKVLVLEKHYEAGGLTHEFKRGPYSWDVGLHYVGDLTKRPLDIVGFKLFNFLTNGKLKWNKMPAVFDKLVFPDFTVEIEKSVKGYKRALYKHFPNSKKEISRYIKDVHRSRIWFLSYFFANFLHSPFRQIFLVTAGLYKKYSTMTTAEYLNKYISDDKLKAALAVRWGNFGIPPTESSFAIHAITEHHYFMGGMFPDGGAEKIAQYIEETIEEYGGKILLSREVEEILVKDNAAYGVRARNLSSKGQEVTEYFAPVIISAAGAKNTYTKLLQDLCLPIQEEIKEHHKGYSALDIYLGLKASPETIGIKGENYWICDRYELNAFSDEFEKQLNGEATYCFVSFPSLKSGTKSSHTADIVTIIPHSIFTKWEEEAWKTRNNEYYDLKEKLTESILKLVYKRIPALEELVVYKEMATPLTFEHFTGKADGAFYGLPSTPDRYKMDLRVKTPVRNLYMSGTDVISNGILPALNSGMATVSYLMGTFGIMKLMNKVFAFKPSKKKSDKHFTDNQSLSEDKVMAVLSEKNITGNLVELTFTFDKNLDLIGGQHIKLMVGDAEWRAYSVAKIDNNRLTLIIDMRPKGFGANYAKNLNVGDKSIFRLPITDLVYHKSDNDIVFIATGTGLIPFLHILDELKKANIKKNITMLFGCINDKDNFADQFIEQYKSFFNIKTLVYVEKPDDNSPYTKGRVTDFFKTPDFNPEKSDFYICGHPHMTESVVKQLRDTGAERVYY